MCFQITALQEFWLLSTRPKKGFTSKFITTRKGINRTMAKILPTHIHFFFVYFLKQEEKLHSKSKPSGSLPRLQNLKVTTTFIQVKSKHQTCMFFCPQKKKKTCTKKDDRGTPEGPPNTTQNRTHQYLTRCGRMWHGICDLELNW